MKNLILVLLFLSRISFADTPPPGTVKSKTYSGDGATAITATGGSLNVNVTNSGGTSTVNQGSPNGGGVNAWYVQGLLGRTWNLSSGSDSVAAVQSGSWTTGRTWTLLNSTDSVNVGNFPSTFGVTQSTSPWVVSGTVAATQSGSWTTGRTWSLLNSTDSVNAVQSGTWNINNISGTISLPTGAATAANQATANASLSSIDSKLTSPITVTGTVTATNSANGNTGSAVPAQAAQVGGSDGTNLRALKVSSTGVLSTDGSATTQPVSGSLGRTWNLASGSDSVAAVQSGAWSTGRTWSLLNTTDSVNAVQSGTWNITNISGTISLPTGAATAANQTTGNSSLSSIDGKLNSLGQKASAASVPVVIASDQSSVPVTATGSGNFTVVQPTGTNLHTVVDSGSITVSGTVTANAGTNLNTSALALDATLTGGTERTKITDGTTNAAVKAASTAAVATDPALVVAISPNNTPVLPSGAATSSNQTSGAAKDQIVDGSGTVYGPATTISAVNYLPVIQASSGTPGAAVPARSTVVAGSDGTNVQTLETDTTGKLIVGPKDSSPATQNITTQDTGSTNTSVANGQVFITGTPTAGSAANFALANLSGIEVQVTGAWTGTLQTEVSMDGGTTWFTRGIKQTGSAYLASSFTANFEGVMNFAGMTNMRVRSVAALPGTATVRVVATNNLASVVISNPLTLRDSTTQSTANTIKAASTAAASADTALVVTLSPNSPTPSSSGLTSVQLVRNDYTSTNVTTGAYVQLVASTSDTTNQLFIFDSSGQTLFLAVGAAASEVNKAYIIPGGNGILNLTIPSGSRVSVKAVSASATVGELSITFLK